MMNFNPTTDGGTVTLVLQHVIRMTKFDTKPKTK
jgi:hypothetical protein